MMTANEIKSTALELGVDLCGIAPVDRFSSAPKGFHPNDVYSKPTGLQASVQLQK